MKGHQRKRKRSNKKQKQQPLSNQINNIGGRDVACNVSTDETIVTAGQTTNDKNILMSNISPKNGTLSTVMRSFKSAVTNYANKNNILDFTWQDRFYDIIIRNEKELYNIKKYIIENPERWECEKS